MDNIALSDLVSNLGSGGLDASEELGQTATALAASKRFDETSTGQFRDIPVVGELASGASEAIISPTLKFGGSAMSLANAVSGDNAFSKDSMDYMANMQYEADKLAKGSSNVNPNMPNIESGGSEALGLAAFMTGAGAGRKVVSEIGRGTEFVLSKMMSKPSIAKTLMEDVSSIGGEIASGIAKKAISLGETTAFGTAATVDGYEPTEDGIQSKEEYGKDFREAFGMNLAMGVMMEAGMSLPKIRSIAVNSRALTDRETSIKGSDEIRVNYTEDIIDDIHESTGGKKGEYIEVPKETKPKKLWESGKYGVFKVQGEEGVIVSVPKTGAYKLYRRIGEDGSIEYYSKASDGNHITKDALMLELETEVITSDGKTTTLRKPLLEAVIKDTETAGAEEFGYGTIKSDGIKVTEEVDGKQRFESTKKTSPEVEKFNAEIRKADNLPKRDVVSGKEGSEVRVERTMVQETILNTLGKGKQDTSSLDDLSARAIENKETIESTASEIFSPTAYKSILDDVINDLVSAAKSSKHRDLVDTLFNRSSKTGNPVNTPKVEFEKALDFALKRNLLKFMSKTKIKDGKIKMSEENFTTLADAVVNDAIDMLGVKHQGGTTMDAFRGDLTAKVRDGSLRIDKFTGKLQDVPDQQSSGTIQGREYELMAKDGTTDSESVLVNMLDHSMENISTANKFNLYDSQLPVASRVAENNIAELSQQMNSIKQTASFDSSKNPVPKWTLGKSMPKGFLKALDRDSLPLYISDGITKLYEVMANTNWHFRGGKVAARKYIQRLSNMADNRPVDFAVYIGALKNVTNKTDLKANFKTDLAYEKVLSIVNAAKEELKEYSNMVEQYKSKHGMFFPVKRVGTARMQYTGFINPQQGIFSKRLFSSDKQQLNTSKIDADKLKKYYDTATRTAIDTFDGLLEHLTKEERDSFNIGELDSFKTIKWEQTPEKVIEVARIINERIETAEADRIKAKQKPKVFTLKEEQAMETIRVIAKNDHNNFNSIIAEADGVTNFKGVANSLLKIDDPNTGINMNIANGNNDVYKNFLDKLSSIFPEFTFVRDDTKLGVQGSAYGEASFNVAIESIKAKTLELIEKSDITGLKSLVKKLKFNEKVTSTEFNKNIRDFFKKLEKHDSLKNILDKANYRERIRDNASLKDIRNITTSINSLDAIESLELKVKNDLYKRMDTLLEQAEALEVRRFIDRVNKNKFRDITESELQTVSKILAKGKVREIDKALESDNVLGKDYIEMKEHVTKIFEKGFLVNENYLRKTRVGQQAMRKILKEIPKVKDSDVSSIMKRMDKYGKTASLHEFTDELHKMGYDSTTSKTIFNALEGYRNVFGTKVLFSSMKGTGYDGATGMQYTTFSPINSPLPFILHSTDSGIVSHASKAVKSIEHRWDSVSGSTLVDLTPELNEATAMVRNKSNIYSDLEMKNIELENKLAGIDDIADIRRDMARKSLLLKDESLTEAGIDAEATRIAESVSKNTEFSRKLSEKAGKLDDRLKDIEKEDRTIMEQYTSGSKDTLQDFENKKIPNLQDKIYDGESIQATIDKKSLEKVDTSKTSLNEMHEFRTLEGSTEYLADDIAQVELGLKSSYKTNGNMSISKTANNLEFWIEASHEAIHHVSKTLGFKKVADIFKRTKDALYDKNFIILKDGSRIKDTIDPKESSILEANDQGPINPDVLYGNELGADLLGPLLNNELIVRNKEQIALLHGKNNISDGIKDLQIKNTKTGEILTFQTVKEFTNFLDSLGISNDIKMMEKIVGRSASVISSSSKMRDFIYGKKIEPWQSTLRSVTKLNKQHAGTIKVLNQRLSRIPFLDLFELTESLEAKETALAYTKGAESQLDAILDEFITSANKDFRDKFGDESTTASKTLGKAWLLGLNKLMFKEVPGFSDLRLSKEDIFGGGKTAKTHTQIIGELKNKVKTFYDSLSKDRSDINKQEISRINNHIKSLAKGDVKYNKQDAINALDRFASRVMNEAEYEAFEAEIAVEQLASIHRIIADTEGFKEVYEFSIQEPKWFDEYMDMANLHSNNYGLFGENVEFQFLENGREGRLVNKEYFKSSGLTDKDIIAEVDGEYVISVESSERIIAAQESNLITINLSEFEVGRYDKGNLKLNAQNIKPETTNVDSSIIKQLSRNVYIANKEMINKDLGYRQWHMLRQAGILLTKSEKLAQEGISEYNSFSKISEHNPLAKGMGEEWWVNNKVLHQIEGAKGIDLNIVAREMVGDTELAKTLAQSAKMIHSYTKVLKGLILLARPSSYINSLISSMGIYWIHRMGGHAIKDWNDAGIELKSYKGKLQEYSRRYAKDPKTGLDYWKTDVATHKLHRAMENGIINTIRADVYKISSMPELQMYKSLRKATSKEYATSMKTIGLDSSQTLGEYLGTVFDMTEMRPKVALYLNLRRAKMSENMAIQKVTMAYPTYNNLPYMLNMIDQVSPYTKFFASTPRMMLYGLDQAPMSTASMFILAQGISPLSFAMASEEEQKKWKWFTENDFIKIPFMDYAYNSNSLFPTVGNPFSSPFGTTPFDFNFAYSATKTLMTPKSYIPGSAL